MPVAHVLAYQEVATNHSLYAACWMQRQCFPSTSLQTAATWPAAVETPPCAFGTSTRRCVHSQEVPAC